MLYLLVKLVLSTGCILELRCEGKLCWLLIFWATYSEIQHFSEENHIFSKSSAFFILVIKYLVQELSSENGVGCLPEHERLCGKLQYIYKTEQNS